MTEELNQDVSSQPAPAVSGSEGPNDSGKPSEAVDTGMTDSQSSDYYNKTQQLAQERKEFEAQRAEFQTQQQQFQTQYGQGAQYQGYNQGYQQPQQPQGLPQGYQTYQQLVNAVGEEAAQTILSQQQQLASTAGQQIQQLDQKMASLEYNYLVQSIADKGARNYGEGWKQKGNEVMDLVKQFPGMKLEQAWNAVNGASAKQDGIDQAYQNQQVKEQANVASNQVNVPAAQAEVNSIDDAMNVAMAELEAG